MEGHLEELIREEINNKLNSVYEHSIFICSFSDNGFKQKGDIDELLSCFMQYNKTLELINIYKKVFPENYHSNYIFQKAEKIIERGAKNIRESLLHLMERE